MLLGAVAVAGALAVVTAPALMPLFSVNGYDTVVNVLADLIQHHVAVCSFMLHVQLLHVTQYSADIITAPPPPPPKKNHLASPGHMDRCAAVREEPSLNPHALCLLAALPDQSAGRHHPHRPVHF